MTGPPVLSRFDLQRQREAIRQGLVRTTTAGALIMVIVLLLAFVALFAALRANWSAEEAKKSSEAAEQLLWKSYLAQARSTRLSGQTGRRSQSLAAVKAAAAISPTPELAAEAIAALALTDIHLEDGVWPIPDDVVSLAFDANLSRCAFAHPNGETRVCRVADRTEMRRCRLTNDWAGSLAFSPAGDLLAGRGRTGVWLWNLNSEGPPVRIARDLAKDETGFSIEFSEDGKTMLVGQADGSVSFHDVRTGTELQRTASIAMPLGFVRLQPGGRTLAANSRDALVLWDIDQNRELHRFVHAQDINSISWSSNAGSLQPRAKTAACTSTMQRRGGITSCEGILARPSRRSSALRATC